MPEVMVYFTMTQSDIPEPCRQIALSMRMAAAAAIFRQKMSLLWNLKSR